MPGRGSTPSQNPARAPNLFTLELQQAARELRETVACLENCACGVPNFELAVGGDGTPYPQLTLANVVEETTAIRQYAAHLTAKVDSLLLRVEEQASCLFEAIHEAKESHDPVVLIRERKETVPASSNSHPLQSLNSTLYLMLSAVAEATGATQASVWLLPPGDRGVLTLVSHLPLESAPLRREVTIGSGLLGAVLRSGVACSSSSETPVVGEPYSVLCMPIRTSEHSVVGVLQLCNKSHRQPFTEEDERILLSQTQVAWSYLFRRYPTDFFSLVPEPCASLIALQKSRAKANSASGAALGLMGAEEMDNNIWSNKQPQLIYRTRDSARSNGTNTSEQVYLSAKTLTDLATQRDTVVKVQDTSLSDMLSYTANLEKMWRSGLDENIGMQKEVEYWQNTAAALMTENKTLRRIASVAARASDIQTIKRELSGHPHFAELLQKSFQEIAAKSKLISARPPLDSVSNSSVPRRTNIFPPLPSPIADMEDALVCVEVCAAKERTEPKATLPHSTQRFGIPQGAQAPPSSPKVPLRHVIGPHR
eukprot:TRINITY_DN9772_c0_g5_i1.p1 TRINITY_DN9772_c0_g5~~TRINITY_DN9772_c0_g5_i1.p1  ORF type:complete len:538 (+),score=67.46 TRINITY_DN9772_c0_g5_i1:28-1641(+)